MTASLYQHRASVKKIVIFGPECSGKTTLARQLANFFHTSWSPEFARPYLTYKNLIEQRDKHGIISLYEDIEPMAIGQMAMEDHAIACATNGMVFHDTNLLTNLVYSQYYFGKSPTWLAEMVRHRVYDGYLLMVPNLPWQADGLRDRPHHRNELLEIFRQALEQYHCCYALVSATGQERFHEALKILQTWQMVTA
ncbi:MAG: ATP-binding protein [Cytophagales bacterium]|nr:ATP-binding protein [Bernardetiaceae bacterium]MDW8210917.1 ATP-binding protein [Cytophagales bacterium]